MLNTSAGHSVLVVWNVILDSPWRDLDMTADIDATLRNHDRFERARFQGRWFSPRQIRYRRAHTTMHSLVLCRVGTSVQRKARWARVELASRKAEVRDAEARWKAHCVDAEAGPTKLGLVKR
jgi:hypothetical protein